MFQGHGGLAMTGDHLDISFAGQASWPRLTEQGSLRAFIFNIGDEAAGPMIQLGLVTIRDDEPLDWRHSIDPLHHHGSDQFRALMRGEWSLAGRRLGAGDYAFQEAGMVYQEHPVAPENWMMLVMGDRRGNQATIASARDEATVFEYDDIYGAPAKDRPYPHPAGDRGLTAIAATAGPYSNGFIIGRGEELVDGAAVSGLIGDVAAGPAVHVLKATAGRTVMPASQWATEVLIAVVAGTVQIGERTYAAGDLRVQREGAPLAAVRAGEAGAHLVLVRGDRRADAIFSAGPAPSWFSAPARLAQGLAPRPGGPPQP